MKLIEKQFQDLMQQCDVNLDRLEKELPKPRVSIADEMERKGVTRRQFLQWTSAMTAALMLPPVFESRVARAAKSFNRPPVIWLHFAECTGCTESVLRTDYPAFDQILLDTISLEYHETLMAPSGEQAEKTLEDAVSMYEGQYVCVIEGAIPTGLDGKYLTLGSQGKTGLEVGEEVTSKAAAVISIGSCASFGNVQAANPNPTDAKGIQDALGIATINIPGCPPNAVNFIGTVLYFILFNKVPPTDDLSRPLWAYGKLIHDTCERSPHFAAGEFAQSWDDEGAKKGWCLITLGCKGGMTYGNCPQVRYNQHTNWPVGAGHGCIGCCQPDFWDDFASLEISPTVSEPEQKARLKALLKKLGVPLTSATAAGLGIGVSKD